jgi:oligoendopeptidase F
MPKLFSKLPKAPARHYVPKNLDCANLQALVRLYEELLARDLPSLNSVKRWLDDVQELSVVLGEYENQTYIRKSVNTRDKKAQSDYLHVIQTISPGLASFKDKLNKKLLEHPLRKKFPKRWSLMLRSRQNAVDLFREKNIPIEQKVEETALKYSQLMGGLEVMFQGKKHTLTQMGIYMEKTDRQLRKSAWETSARRRYEEREKINAIYDELVHLRTDVARNAGFKNFRDFCHQRYDRFDYTPKDCFVFHESVEEVVMPAIRKIRARRAKEMNLTVLKPWDVAVDPEGRPPLNPFKKGSDLASRCQKAFARVDRELGSQFQKLIDCGVLDLDNRPGKEPGGYQSTLEEHRLPFIFMNAVGRDTDVRTLLHEGGHAFHMLAAKDEPVLDYRHAPIEFCEVASMGMELLANREIGIFYPKNDDRERSTRVQLEGTLEVLPWVATIDAFQHWIYTHPKHRREERTAAWMKLRSHFADGTDWSEHQKYEEVLWHRQLHLFGVPFYYIEYGIAQLGALMVWRRSLKNSRQALESYKAALELGGSVGLKELFKTAGGKLDFSSANMRPCVEAVMEFLGY